MNIAKSLSIGLVAMALFPIAGEAGRCPTGSSHPASFARTYRMPGLVSVPISDADPMTIELMTAGDDGSSPAAALARLISEQSDDGRIDAEEWAHG